MTSNLDHEPNPSAAAGEPDPDDLADLLDQAKDAALDEDWSRTRQHVESAIDALDAAGEDAEAKSWAGQTFASTNWLVVAGIAIMIIGGILWFRSEVGLEDISDDLRVIETFTNDANRMKTILSLEDDREIRQITRGAGIGAIVGGALLTTYAFTRPRRRL